MLRKVMFFLAVLTSILTQHHARTEAARRPGIDVYRTVPGVGRFRLHEQARSYEDAVVECGNEEAHLAVPVSKDVQDALLGMLHASDWTGAFIGVNDLAVEGKMVTVQGDLWSDVGYTRWESGEPNNAFGTEDCVVFERNALLNDWNCTSRLAFFCEKNDFGVASARGFVNSDDCGQSSAQDDTVVVRGTATRKGEWPWVAAIYKVTSSAQFLCAGSLVSKKHVLTAAHCLVTTDTSTTRDPKSLVVHLGRYDLSRAEPHEQTMVVVELLDHPSYKTSVKLDHDISILVLDTAATITDFVRPVCLWDNNLDPTPEHGVPGQLVNKLGSAPGWSVVGSGEFATDMRLTRMPVVSQSTCIESDPEFFAATISNLTFCAGVTNGTTLCNGESGRGLFFYQENPKTQRKSWFVRGIVSLSKATDDMSCNAYNFVVFTDVSMFQDWIKTSLALSPPV